MSHSAGFSWLWRDPTASSHLCAWTTSTSSLGSKEGLCLITSEDAGDAKIGY